MPRERIIFLDNLPLTKKHIQKLISLGHLDLTPAVWPKESEIITRVKKATILVSKWIYISEKIIRSSPSLRFIVMAMTGYHDWIDLTACQKFQIKVANVPAFSTEAVAEHAIMLMLSVARKLLPATSDLRSGNFNPESHQGLELQGKTLGIIGFGHIGQRTGQIAKSFGMKILMIDSKSSRQDLENTLKNSQILSINVPHTPQTKKLIGEKELNLLPQGAILINTSRGKVIDELALIRHLKNGHLGGAGLDVFTKEPPSKNNPLFSLPNVVATPHIAWNTKESFLRLADGVVANIEAFIKGKPINIVSN